MSFLPLILSIISKVDYLAQDVSRQIVVPPKHVAKASSTRETEREQDGARVTFPLQSILALGEAQRCLLRAASPPRPEHTTSEFLGSKTEDAKEPQHVTTLWLCPTVPTQTVSDQAPDRFTLALCHWITVTYQKSTIVLFNLSRNFWVRVTAQFQLDKWPNPARLSISPPLGHKPKSSHPLLPFLLGSKQTPSLAFSLAKTTANLVLCSSAPCLEKPELFWLSFFF